MSSATLTSKGQITIPKAVRDALELDPGDRIEFRLREDGVVEMRAQDVDLLHLVGVVKPSKRGVTLEQMSRDIAAAHARANRPSRRRGS